MIRQALLLLLAVAVSARAGTFLYVSAGKDGLIQQFRFNPETGALKKIGEAAGKGCGPQVVDRARQHLYVSLRAEKSVAVFRIAPASGKLTLLKKTPVAGNAGYLSLDRTERFLFSSYYGEGQMAIHAIAEDRSVREEPVAVIQTAEKAHCALPAPDNKLVIVPHTGANRLFQFAFDEKTGKATLLDPPFVEALPDQQPRHIAYHPDKPLVYAVNEREKSVSVYPLKNGTLQRSFQTISTLPPQGFEGRSSCADIEITPDRRFLFASTRGHDSIAGFSIDPVSGGLKEVSRTPTEERPRSFNIGPAGKWLVAAGQTSGKLAIYRIQKDGTLKRVGTQPVGQGPSWVQFVKTK